MKLAIRAFFVTLILLMLVFAAAAQPRSDKDPRNTSPTVGTGGAEGGPTGLFTVYDGQTLRKGEYTFSFAYSNYDRDPGNADITSVPGSFQLGVGHGLEFFFANDLYRAVKINSPRMLSSFYLPNSQLRIGGVLTSGGAIVLAPQGTGISAFAGQAVYRPQGLGPFVQWPFSGGNAGTYGLLPPFFSGPQFGFGAGTNAQLGPPAAGGGAGTSADRFPGIGSVYGSILPGIVLSTTPLFNAAGGPAGTAPLVFTTRPTYLPDAPFINRTYGESSFSTFTAGAKWRLTHPDNAVGVAIIAFYRWYQDKAKSFTGFNMLQRGSSPGGNNGDVGVSIASDARLAEWVNFSANVGYTYNSSVVGNFPTGNFTILDRPDEFTAAIGLDFPINRFVQPEIEFRTLRYVGGHTPNALQNNPIEGLAGIKIYPRRWFGFGAAYRIHLNQMDASSFKDSSITTQTVVICRPGATNCTPTTTTNTFQGVPPGFDVSSNPHGLIAQFWIGRRDKREGPVVNQAPSVDSVALTDTVITLGCPPGYKSTSGKCNDNRTIGVATKASDPENDLLTYNYTVSGGKISGTGANVSWDLSNAQEGTYTITTGVDDGCGVCGKTNTQTIRVEKCPDCVQICNCPPLTVSGPSGVTSPGSPMTFNANTTGDVTYNWSVSAGTISSGQGTPSITVDTTGLAGQNVTATVEIGGRDPGCNCVINASETAGVAPKPIPNLVDEFGALKDDDVKARIDTFYIALNNDPSAHGYIINYGTPAQIKARRAQIMKAINFRKYDVSRVTFVDGPDNGTGVNTKLYTVPAGADNPTP